MFCSIFRASSALLEGPNDPGRTYLLVFCSISTYISRGVRSEDLATDIQSRELYVRTYVQYYIRVPVTDLLMDRHDTTIYDNSTYVVWAELELTVCSDGHFRKRKVIPFSKRPLIFY
jgi:hypothetical protein